MRYLLLIALAIPMYAQFGAAKQVVNGIGAPASAKCASANNVGLVYARKDGAAAYSTFYVCSNSAASTYTWELMGAGGGSGVTSVDATGGVQTASGAAITATGTVRGAHIGKADTATTYTFLTGDRGKVVTLCNAAGVAVTLPNAGAGFEDGWFVVAKNICAGDAVITPTTATISGAATATISNGEFLLISSNGTNYEGDGNRTVAGSGMTLTKARTGVTMAVDTAVILSRATDQAGTGRFCRSTTGNDTWTCTLTPTLTTYGVGGVGSGGVCVQLNPNAANTGAATLAIDGLAALAVVTHAGAALTTGDILADLPTTLCYDGTSMVMQGDGGSAAAPGGSGTELQYRGGASTFSALANSSVPNAGELWVGDQAANGSATRALFQVGDVAWASGNASGTQFGINATSGFVGSLIDGKVNSTTVFRVAGDGTVESNVFKAANSAFQLGTTALTYVANSNIAIGNTSTGASASLTLTGTAGTAAANFFTIRGTSGGTPTNQIRINGDSKCVMVGQTVETTSETCSLLVKNDLATTGTTMFKVALGAADSATTVIITNEARLKVLGINPRTDRLA